MTAADAERRPPGLVSGETVSTGDATGAKFTPVTDRRLSIAVGQYAQKNNKHWIVKKPILWSKFCEMEPVASDDKHAVQSYVLGELVHVSGQECGGKPCDGIHRNGNSVLSRSAITLDADYCIEVGDPDGDLLRQRIKESGHEALVYSTYSSKDGAARLRVVVPLDRDVSPQEYGHLARLLMVEFGGEEAITKWEALDAEGVIREHKRWGPFDVSSDQYTRFMYVQASPDGTGYRERFHGDLFDPDLMLLAPDPAPPVERPDAVRPTPGKAPSPWAVQHALERLDDAVRYVARAGEGIRNDDLLKHAAKPMRFALGGCYGTDGVAVVVERLTEAALTTGLDEGEIEYVLLRQALGYAEDDGPEWPKSPEDFFEAFEPEEGAVEEGSPPSEQVWCEWNDCGQGAVNGRHCQMHADNWEKYLESQKPESKRAAAVEKQVERLRINAEAHRLFRQEQMGEEQSGTFVAGGSFLLDIPDETPAMWGEGSKVIWAKGEGCMIVGPPGVGKTTVAAQVLEGLILGDKELFGLPITRAESKVLYLAMDRPAQIARALARTLRGIDRETLDERLVFRKGPPPADVADEPEVLLDMAVEVGASVIVVDSVKDAAVGLVEDRVGASYNKARQFCLANGVEVLDLHHLVKRGADGKEPTTLADVYGSAWLTAGAGSVVLLWGQAGDDSVRLSHLKQPGTPFGPVQILHDHAVGRSTIDTEEVVDLLGFLRQMGAEGLGTLSAAQHMSGTDGKVIKAEKAKARRALNALVRQGLATRDDDAENWVATVPPDFTEVVE